MWTCWTISLLLFIHAFWKKTTEEVPQLVNKNSTINYVPQLKILLFLNGDTLRHNWLFYTQKWIELLALMALSTHIILCQHTTVPINK